MFFKKRKEEQENFEETRQEANPEQELKKKNTRKAWIRGFLIVLNAALACYLLYFISDSIVEIYRKYFTDENPAIFSINGMSEKDSLERYNEAIDRKEDGTYSVEDVLNYEVYGGYLHFNNFAEKQKEEPVFSSYETYTLRDLSSDVSYSSNLVFKNVQDGINYGIPLFELKKGDCIVYPYEWPIENKEKKPIKIESENGIFETFYSPIQNGTRKIIELKSRSSSPALLLSVRLTPTLDANRHDVAILYDSEEDKNAVINLFSKELQYQEIKRKTEEKENLISLYKSQSLVCLILENNDEIRISHFIKWEDSTINFQSDNIITEGDLKEYDEDIYIRELGGNCFMAGQGYTEENRILHPYRGTHDAGSFVIHVGKSRIQDIPNLLNSLLKFTL